ncbi:AI-2E family transporter [Candidatus Saccharibacteria bacterium]|nr:AI-2E family transporter [Candidatus Saccharibacteria bacterium]
MFNWLKNLFGKQPSDSSQAVTAPSTAVTSRKAAAVLLIIALVGGAYFVRDYLGALALAALLVILSDPLHTRLSRRPKLGRFATLLTIIIVLLVVIIPVVIVVALSLYDATLLYDQIQQQGWLSSDNLRHVADSLTSGINQVPGVSVSRDSVRNLLINAAKQIGPALINFVLSASSNIFRLFIDIIVFFMLFAILLTRKADVLQLIRHLSPFDEAIDDEYFRSVRAMSVAMVKGTFVIALIVGFFSTLTLWIVGFGYLPFWFVLFTFLSLVPLGSAIVFFPIGMILVVLGQTWQGVLIMLVQVVIINNVDNVMRPYLAPKESNLPAVLLLVGAFAGVSFFGMLGVVYGPVIMILLYTTISLYDRHRIKGIPLKY